MCLFPLFNLAVIGLAHLLSLMTELVWNEELQKKQKQKNTENDNPACDLMRGKYDAGHWAVVMEKSGGEAVIS